MQFYFMQSDSGLNEVNQIKYFLRITNIHYKLGEITIRDSTFDIVKEKTDPIYTNWLYVLA